MTSRSHFCFKFIYLFVSILSLSTYICVPAYAENAAIPQYIDSFTTVCTSVIDGDTIECVEQNGKVEKIRLLGIDAPELDQKLGEKAKSVLSSLILNKEIRVKSPGRDTNLQILGKIFLPDNPETSVNSILVGNGYAKCAGNTDYSSAFKYYEDIARQKGRGIWLISEYKEMPNAMFFKELKGDAVQKPIIISEIRTKNNDPSSNVQKEENINHLINQSIKSSNERIAELRKEQDAFERRFEADQINFNRKMAKNKNANSSTASSIDLEKGVIEYSLSLEKSNYMDGFVVINCKISNRSEYLIDYIGVDLCLRSFGRKDMENDFSNERLIPKNSSRILQFTFDEKKVGKNISLSNCELIIDNILVKHEGKSINATELYSLRKMSF